MSQLNITAGQTPLLVSDFIAMAKAKNSQLARQANGSDITDFLTPFKETLPNFASGYAKTYYNVPSNISSPKVFSSAKETTTIGNVYEEDVPADCIDDGIFAVSITYGADGKVDPTKIVKSQNEVEWTSATDTTIVNWKQDGRKVRFHLPTSYSASTPKYALGYKRFCTVPQVAGDAIDVPAEDVTTYFNQWYASLIIL